jgi:hypothetical protein
MRDQLAEFGPVYPDMGAKVKKWRELSRHRPLTAEESQAYSDELHARLKSIQRAEWQVGLLPMNPRPRCASRSWAQTGEEIEKAMREQHRAMVLRWPGEIRRARTDLEWEQMYIKAMKEKHGYKWADWYLGYESKKENHHDPR